MASNPRCQRQQSAASANESFFPESRRLTRPSRFSNMRPKKIRSIPPGLPTLQPYDIAYSDTVALNLEAPVAFNLEIGRGNTPTAACTEMPSRDRGRPKGWSAVDAHGGKMGHRSAGRSCRAQAPRNSSTTSLGRTPAPRNAAARAPPTCCRRILMHRVAQSPAGLVF